MIFKLAKEMKIEDLEIYTAKSANKSLKTFNQKIESYKISNQNILSIRGIYNSKMGYVYTEDLEEDPQQLLAKLIDNSTVITNTDIEQIFGDKVVYKEAEKISTQKITYQESFDLLVKTEKLIKNYSDKITDTSGSYTDSTSAITICNSKGLNLSKKIRYFFVYLSAIAKDNNDTTNAYEYQLTRNFSSLDSRKLAQETAKNAIEAIGAKPCPSKKYNLLLKNSVSSDILDQLKGQFYASNVQKQMSSLSGKLNQKIVGEAISITDNPFIECAINNDPFDDEGVPTTTTAIIQNGKLVNYLYNLKSAKKDNVKTTGNGFKGSVAAKVGTSSTNIFIEPKDSSFQELLTTLNEGIYITEVSGTNSGINKINGDFSLQASGFLVKDGKIGQPVKLITIADNYFKMLEKVIKVGNDLKLDYSGVGSPSLLVADISVSGQ